MAFDQSTRNRLQKFVNDARNLLTEEFNRQLQATYGLDPKAGSVAAVDSLTHLDNRQRQTANVLRDTLAHYLATTHGKGEKDRTKQALSRIVREQAFTVLNRLAALRMAEARGFLLETIAKGYNAKGFQLYKQLAGSSLGETGEAYRNYLYSVFDEFSLDLAVLFDRHSAQGRLFPRESALLGLLDLINHHEIEPLWAEDETIGWIYQYFNSQEERKKMRAESQAPRNSRELAVRNQFFTPRYVVEFLTDNTLGRIWYEMTQGKTSLIDSCRYLVRRPTEVFLKPGELGPEQEKAAGEAEALSQEELLKQPVYIPHRAIKDPRCIRMLDPACGSMHFGLYAFDLYERIYEEAWQLEAELGAEAFVREGDLKPLHLTYESFEDFKAEIPRLIIEHNIHGVDIDPRAVQIAGLSLWQRAQRAWQQQGIKPQQRPVVRKSNIVCAEPMPGEKALLQEFSSTLNPPVLRQLLEAIFDKMELAGEAGTLLKIEEEIQSSIDEARNQWQGQSGSNSIDDMFRAELDQATPEKELGFDLSGVDDESFWDGAEQLILEELSNYAEKAVSNVDQKRLFAEDAAKGFAFIDLCRKRFDIVLMNPPFGEPSKQTAAMLRELYPVAKDNLYIAFVSRSFGLTDGEGLVGCISDRTFIAQTRYEDYRRAYLLGEAKARVRTLADLGWGVLDAWVQTAAYVIESANKEKTEAVFVDFDENSDNKKHELLDIVSRARVGGLDPHLFVLSVEDLQLLPGAAMCFWLPAKVVHHFAVSGRLDPDFVDARIGLSSGDNGRFYSLAWEVPRECIGRGNRWARLTNGGAFSPFYRDQFWVIYWENNGEVIKQKARDAYVSETRTIKNQKYYWRPALTFGKRTEDFTVQTLPRDHIFTDEGHCLYFHDREDVWWLLAITNSSFVADLLNSIAGLHKTSGYVGTVPVPKDKHDAKQVLGAIAESCCQRIRTLFASVLETSGFVGPVVDLTSLVGQAISNIRTLECELNSALKRIDEGVFNLYDIPKSVFASVPPRPVKLGKVIYDVESEKALSEICCGDLLAYFVGCSLGRWDIRYATSERQPPELPDPFDPLPVCPPGMLQNVEGLPAEPKDMPADYPLSISWHGILVDDENHSEDIVARAHEAIEVIWKDRAEAIEQEACDILGVKNLREYFRRPAAFFADHLKRYSKSRRQAPIYWPLQIPSGSYTLWLYYHRLNEQTLYACVNDFVQPKLEKIEEDLNTLRGKSARSSQEEKELEKLNDLASELQDFRDELLRIAKLWRPNLNDGVQITAAPLWKLFQHKAWQKKLKETWEKLEKGDYGWAHLACSIWPERVLRKCHQDRSLAIAHDVENTFWHEIEVPVKRGKKATGETKLEWQPKELTDDELDALIQAKIMEKKA